MVKWLCCRWGWRWWAAAGRAGHPLPAAHLPGPGAAARPNRAAAPARTHGRGRLGSSGSAGWCQKPPTPPHGSEVSAAAWTGVAAVSTRVAAGAGGGPYPAPRRTAETQGAAPMPAGSEAASPSLPPEQRRVPEGSTVGCRGPVGCAMGSACRSRTGFVSRPPAPPALQMCQLLWRHRLFSAGGA